MNITKENIDALNAVVKVDIVADDYQTKVTKILNDYRKKATIPGFRKGHVPIGMVKKQYGKSVTIDEVSKLLQESLNTFLIEEKLDILGNPLPKRQDNFSWDSDTYSFEFELGLAPQFEVNLKSKKKVTQYHIIADDNLIDKEIENLQSRYGKMLSRDIITEDTTVTGTFTNEEEINKKTIIAIKDIKGKANLKKFLGAKVGDVIKANTKKLFKNDYKLSIALGISEEDSKELDTNVSFTIEEITSIELADLNQELFDKLFPDRNIKSVKALRNEIREDAEKRFQTQADQQLLNAVTEHLITHTTFDLPVEFLQKWLTTSGEKEISLEEAKEQYEKSEKGLRYQLIEDKIIKDNNISLEYEELVNYAKGVVKYQMAQFGNTNPEDRELENIAAKILANPKETKNLQNQLTRKKLIAFYKENMSFKTKEVTYENFIKEIYNVKNK